MTVGARRRTRGRWEDKMARGGCWAARGAGAASFVLVSGDGKAVAWLITLEKGVQLLAATILRALLYDFRAFGSCVTLLSLTAFI